MKRKMIGFLFLLAFVCALFPVTACADGTWMDNSIGRWYQNEDGSNPAGCWQMIDGTWYYFNETGYMHTGWLEYAGNLYYLDTDGAMVTGWIRIDDVWYCFNDNGTLQTQWYSIDGTSHNCGNPIVYQAGGLQQYSDADYLRFYEPIIQKYVTYYKALEENDHKELRWFEYEVSECCNYCTSPGYAIMDVDGDGTKELIIADNNSEYTDENCYPSITLCMYTISNGEIQKVFESWPRSRTYYIGNGNFLNEGSNGAAYTLISVSTYSKGQLTAYDGVMSSDNYDPSTGVYWYRTTDTSGRYPENLRISDEEAYRLRDEWEAQITVPELTPLFEK